MKPLALLLLALPMFGQVTIAPTSPSITYTPSSLAFARPSNPLINFGISNATAANGSATLSISATRSTPPAGVLSAASMSTAVSFTTADIGAMACVAGPTLTAAGKTLSQGPPMVGTATTTVLVATSMSQSTIGDGVWAICTFSGVVRTTQVSLSTPKASSKFGTAIATGLTPNPGNITVSGGLIAGVFSCDPTTETPGALVLGEQVLCHAGVPNTTAAPLAISLTLSGPDAARYQTMDAGGTVLMSSCSIAPGSSQCNFVVEGI